MKIDRLVSIIMILLDRKKVLASTLADEFEVSLRTIYRDIDSINMAGIPVYATRGVNGGFQILDDYKITKASFSTNDLTTILSGLNNLKTMVSNEELVNAITKVKNFIPPEHAEEIDLRINQIVIDTNNWMGNKDISHFLELIKEALSSNKLIEILYLEKSGQEELRKVEPCQLILKSNSWYLYGFCHLREAYRTFKISRIIQIKLLAETLKIKDFPKHQLDFNNSKQADAMKVKLKIHKSIMERLLDYCSIADFTKIDDEFYYVLFPYFDNDYYYDFILGFGPRCEIIEPKALRTTLKERIKSVLILYN